MPSPFPGMDPYLEGVEWLPFHTLFMTEIVRQLAPRLRPRYLVYPERRFDLEPPQDLYEVALVAPGPQAALPDASVVELAPAPARIAPAGNGAAAGAPLRLATLLPEPVPLVGIEIRDVADRRLVTAIEVHSPSNKRAPGRDAYLAKRNRLLASTAHLLEIDLLRHGQRVPMRDPLPRAPYFVLLSRAAARPLTEVWPVMLTDPLPTVPVPLLEGDADVLLDLQRTFTAVYDVMGYDLSLNYTRPPDVPLTPEGQAWADERLRAFLAARANP